MKLADIGGLDPDTLPYFVLAPDKTAVPVAFAPLTPAGVVALSLAPWDSAIFALHGPLSATMHR